MHHSLLNPVCFGFRDSDQTIFARVVGRDKCGSARTLKAIWPNSRESFAEEINRRGTTQINGI
ncbi:MAG: hypothetical protein CL902_07445 [Dehalococcoidia bacterium]|nr:hypothetical protein [Dehalococcoidia bacterium]